jgi:16S rRNA (cytidine1402-2'-O)-methyltransferase
VTGTLFVVGTPIGNLEDLSERARATLASVDLVAAEDTRRAGRLLQHLGVHARLVSLFDANEAARVPELLERLRAGDDVALISDAGMPGVSDPGYRVVAACADAGVPVDVVPGPSSAIAALVVSGLPTDRFAFEGFLPRGGKARAERFAALAGDPRTVVIFESPRRVAATLADAAAALGERRAVVARELTKLHQEVLRGSLSQLAEDLRERELKGEVVLVVEGARDDGGGKDRMPEAVEIARRLVDDGAKKRAAAREAASRTGVASGEVYEHLLNRASE